MSARPPPVRILSGEDVRACVTMPQAIDAMRDVFSQVSAGDAEVPVRHALETGAGVSLFMPAWLGRSRDLGAKIVSVMPGNRARGLPAIHAVVVVLDPDTGLCRGLLDGTWLTGLRTGATQGLAVDLLAPADAAVLAVFGAGVQAPFHIEAVRAVRPIREVRIVSRSPDSAAALAAALEGVEARVEDDPAAAVRGAQVVVTCSTSPTPVFPAAALEPGTHVSAIGTFTPDAREVETGVVVRSRVVVESREAALEEAGDLVIPIAEGRLDPERLVELGDILAGDAPRGPNGHSGTFFKSVGTAAQDVAVGRIVLERAEAEGLGTVVQLG